MKLRRFRRTPARIPGDRVIRRRRTVREPIEPPITTATEHDGIMRRRVASPVPRRVVHTDDLVSASCEHPKSHGDVDVLDHATDHTYPAWCPLLGGTHATPPDPSNGPDTEGAVKTLVKG